MDIALDAARARIAPKRSDSAIAVRRDSLELAAREVLHQLAHLAAGARPEWRRFLTKDYTSLTLDADGEYDLSLQADLHRESLGQARIMVATFTEPADFYEDEKRYLLGTPLADIPRVTVTGNVLKTRSGTDEITVASAALNIYDAIYEPVIAASALSTTLPKDLEEAFLTLLIDEARELYGREAAASE